MHGADPERFGTGSEYAKSIMKNEIAHVVVARHTIGGQALHRPNVSQTDTRCDEAENGR